MNVSEEAAASLVLDFLLATGCEQAAEALDAALGDTRHGVKPLHALQSHFRSAPGESTLLNMVKAVLSKATPAGKRMQAQETPQPACSLADAGGEQARASEAGSEAKDAGMVDNEEEQREDSAAAVTEGQITSATPIEQSAQSPQAEEQGEDAEAAMEVVVDDEGQEESTSSDSGYGSDSFDESSSSSEGEEEAAVADEAAPAEVVPEAEAAPHPFPGATSYFEHIQANVATVPDLEAVDSAAARAAKPLSTRRALRLDEAAALRQRAVAGAQVPAATPDAACVWKTGLRLGEGSAAGRWRVHYAAEGSALPPALQATGAALQAETLQRLYYADPSIFDEEGSWAAAEWDVAPCSSACAAARARSGAASCAHRPWVPMESEGTPLEPAPRQLQRAVVLAATQLLWRCRPDDAAPAMVVLPPAAPRLASADAPVDGYTEACEVVSCSSRSEVAAVLEGALAQFTGVAAPGLLLLTYSCLATAGMGAGGPALTGAGMLALLRCGSVEGGTPLAAWGSLPPLGAGVAPAPPPLLPIWVAAPPAAPLTTVFAAPKGSFDEGETSGAVQAYRWSEDAGVSQGEEGGEGHSSGWGILARIPPASCTGLAARAALGTPPAGGKGTQAPALALIVPLDDASSTATSSTEEDGEAAPAAAFCALVCGAMPPPASASGTPRSGGPMSPSFSSSGRFSAYNSFLAEATAAVSASAAEPLKPAPPQVAASLTAFASAFLPAWLWKGAPQR